MARLIAALWFQRKTGRSRGVRIAQQRPIREHPPVEPHVDPIGPRRQRPHAATAEVSVHLRLNLMRGI